MADERLLGDRITDSVVSRNSALMHGLSHHDDTQIVNLGKMSADIYDRKWTIFLLGGKIGFRVATFQGSLWDPFHQMKGLLWFSVCHHLVMRAIALPSDQRRVLSTKGKEQQHRSLEPETRSSWQNTTQYSIAFPLDELDHQHSKRSSDGIEKCVSLNSWRIAHHWRNSTCNSLVSPYDTTYLIRCGTYELDNESEWYAPWAPEDDVGMIGKCPGDLVCANKITSKNSLNEINVGDIMCVPRSKLHYMTSLIYSGFSKLTCTAEQMLACLDAIYPTTYQLVIEQNYAHADPVPGGDKGSHLPPTEKDIQRKKKRQLKMEQMYIERESRIPGIRIRSGPEGQTTFASAQVTVRPKDPPAKVKYCYETPASEEWKGTWHTVTYAALVIAKGKRKIDHMIDGLNSTDITEYRASHQMLPQ